MIPDKDVLYVTFVKPLNSPDEYLNIGRPDGLFYYVDGPSHLNLLNSKMWLDLDGPLNFNDLKTTSTK